MATTLITITGDGVTIETDGGTVHLSTADFSRIAQRVVGRRDVPTAPPTAPRAPAPPKTPAPTATEPAPLKVVAPNGTAPLGIGTAVMAALGTADGHALKTGQLVKAVSEARGRTTSGGAVNAALVSLLAAGQLARNGSIWQLAR